jgi:hypothetical protein
MTKIDHGGIKQYSTPHSGIALQYCQIVFAPQNAHLPAFAFFMFLK